MKDELRISAENNHYETEEQIASEADLVISEASSEPTPALAPSIPDYLQNSYSWAYLHPKSLWVFEREWVVNLILWGNMNKLTNAVLDEIKLPSSGIVLQVACVYGRFSNQLASHLSHTGSMLSVADVAPIQIRNAEKKLERHENISVHHQDSTNLSFSDNSVGETIVFFLLHEQPEHARRKTVAEAIRVTRPGGKVVFVDYHKPRRLNPMRYIMKPVLTVLEPFALDLWREKLPSFMPPEIKMEQVSTSFYFGGLYQKVVVDI